MGNNEDGVGVSHQLGECEEGSAWQRQGGSLVCSSFGMTERGKEGGWLGGNGNKCCMTIKVLRRFRRSTFFSWASSL